MDDLKNQMQVETANKVMQSQGIFARADYLAMVYSRDEAHWKIHNETT